MILDEATSWIRQHVEPDGAIELVRARPRTPSSEDAALSVGFRR